MMGVGNCHATRCANNLLEADIVVKDVSPRCTSTILVANIKFVVRLAVRDSVVQGFTCKGRISIATFRILCFDSISHRDIKGLRGFAVKGNFELAFMTRRIDIVVIELGENIGHHVSRVDRVVKCNRTPTKVDARRHRVLNASHTRSNRNAFNIHEVVWS